MDNRLDNSRCPECGGLFALIGYRHRCVARTKVEPAIEPPVAVQKVKRAEKKIEAVARRKGVTAADAILPGYRYRDVEKRRIYCRDKMREYRARKLEKH